MIFRSNQSHERDRLNSEHNNRFRSDGDGTKDSAVNAVTSALEKLTGR